MTPTEIASWLINVVSKANCPSCDSPGRILNVSPYQNGDSIYVHMHPCSCGARWCARFCVSDLDPVLYSENAAARESVADSESGELTVRTVWAIRGRVACEGIGFNHYTMWFNPGAGWSTDAGDFTLNDERARVLLRVAQERYLTDGENGVGGEPVLDMRIVQLTVLGE